MSRPRLRLIAGFTVLAFASACASTTVIKSSPPGARVFIDGSFVGQTPYPMTDTKIVGATTHVQLKLDGYEDFSGVITRSEEFNAGACLGGVLFLIPFLWIQGYRPERTYEMTPLRYAPPGYPGAPGYYPQGYGPPGYPPPQQIYPGQPYPQQPYPPPQGAQYAPPPQPQGASPVPASQPPPAPPPQQR